MFHHHLYNNIFMDCFDINGNPIFSDDVIFLIDDDQKRRLIYYYGDGKGESCDGYQEYDGIIPSKHLENGSYASDSISLLDKTVYLVVYFSTISSEMIGIARAELDFQKAYKYYTETLAEENLTFSDEADVLPDFLEQKIIKTHIWKDAKE